MVKDIEVINFLHELFEDPRRWTQKSPAKDVDGRQVAPTSSTAACFCLTGGLERYAGSSVQYNRLMIHIKKHLPGKFSKSVILFNDNILTTVEDVRAVLKATATDLKHA